MSTLVAELISELDALANTLQGYSARIAAELRKGKDAEVVQVDILRPEIMRLLSEVNQVVMRCGRVPGPERTSALFAKQDYMRFQATRWQGVDMLLGQQLPPRERPLSGPRSKVPTANWTLNSSTDTLLNGIHQVFGAARTPQSVFEADPVLSVTALLSAFHAAHRVLLAQKREAPTRFLDVGCGVGMRLLSAKPYFGSCAGLDDQDMLVATANKLLNAASFPAATVQQADVMTFETYEAYDVVCLWQPMGSSSELQSLARQILSQVTSGTLIIAPSHHFATVAAELNCHRLMGPVFVSDHDQASTDMLRTEASFTGFSLGSLADHTAGLWDDIIETSAKRGFVLQPTNIDFPV